VTWPSQAIIALTLQEVRDTGTTAVKRISVENLELVARWSVLARLSTSLPRKEVHVFLLMVVLQSLLSAIQVTLAPLLTVLPLLKARLSMKEARLSSGSPTAEEEEPVLETP